MGTQFNVGSIPGLDVGSSSHFSMGTRPKCILASHVYVTNYDPCIYVWLQADVLEDAIFKNVIILQTVQQEVRNVPGEGRHTLILVLCTT